MTAVVVSGVAKSFPGTPPVPALVDVHLDVPAGDVFAVLGPSGCGKTTLLRIIAGFEQPDRGSVALGTTVVATSTSSVPPERRHIGIVPQEGGLFPHLDVAANVAFGLRDLDRRERRRRVDEMLELVDLAGYGSRRPHELSGGQQQRVALARALAPAPGLILLDEPFAALDTSLRTALRDDVKAVLATSATTAIIVTHDQTEALTMADTVAVMRAGRVVQVDPPTALYQRPVDLETARMIGEYNVVDATVDGAGVATSRFGRHAVAGSSAAGAPATVLVRPEQIRPADDGVEATIVSVRFEGATTELRLLVDGLEVAARWMSIEVPDPAARCRVRVEGSVVAYPSA